MRIRETAGRRLGTFVPNGPRREAGPAELLRAAACARHPASEFVHARKHREANGGAAFWCLRRRYPRPQEGLVDERLENVDDPRRLWKRRQIDHGFRRFEAEPAF